MKFYQKERIPDIVAPVIAKKLTPLLNLTRAGAIRFAAFPDNAVEETLLAYKKQSKIENPLGWFLKSCHNWCKDKSIDPDWNFVERMKLKHIVPVDAPEVKPQPSRPSMKPLMVQEKKPQISPREKIEKLKADIIGWQKILSLPLGSKEIRFPYYQTFVEKRLSQDMEELNDLLKREELGHDFLLQSII